MRRYAAREGQYPPPRALLIEDHEQLLDCAASFLAARGMDVTATPDGAEGLTLAREELFDVVVADVVMPGSGGTAVASALSALGSKVPIAIVTGYGTDFIENDLDGLGIKRVLSKPFELKELAGIVKELAAERRGLDEGEKR